MAANPRNFLPRLAAKRAKNSHYEPKVETEITLEMTDGFEPQTQTLLTCFI